MITSSMTYKEMYDHLAADLGKVEYRKAYYLPKAVKEFRRAVKFPVWKWYEYKVPTNSNKYIIFFYAENAYSVEKPKMGFFVDVFFDRQRYIVKWGAGGYRPTPTTPIKAIRQIHAYTSHFLHRYNERFIKDASLSTNDIACCYLSRNDIAMPIEINESINKNIEKYGERARQGFRVRDGICFTRIGCEGDRDKNRVDAMLIVYATYMSEYKMSDSQRLAIDKEHWEKWTQSYMDFIKESNNGVLSLRLDP